jgi:aspartate kinase
MKVFKFGGASVKDAQSVKNVAQVLKQQGVAQTLVVVSAMGKMTNALEKVVDAYVYKKPDLQSALQEVSNYHQNIIAALFDEKNHPIYIEKEILLGQLSGFLIKNKSKDYNYIYDQIVCFGELLSTKIVSAFLNEQGIVNEWIDVRHYIKTNAAYRDAVVNWEQTRSAIEKLDSGKLYVTQGFLGSTDTFKTTTLGREGSDYTAAVFAYCLNAQQVTIWKDVAGVLNADPRHFSQTVLLEQISYTEAIEMAFYGASVIHPKTLKPLENKNIPLYVKSFIAPQQKGTVVAKGNNLVPAVPCFIVKENQILVHISALDFSFMVEHNISDIFKVLHAHKLKVNLIQNSAISFSVCIEDKYNTFEAFLTEMRSQYKVTCYTNVVLYTIRHATPQAIAAIEQKGQQLLKQAATGTVQLVLK